MWNGGRGTNNFIAAAQLAKVSYLKMICAPKSEGLSGAAVRATCCRTLLPNSVQLPATATATAPNNINNPGNELNKSKHFQATFWIFFGWKVVGESARSKS